MRRAALAGLSIVWLLWTGCGEAPPQVQKTEAQGFLRMYEDLYQGLSRASGEADWKAATDLNSSHLGEKIGAGRALAVFVGSRYVIENSRRFLRQRDLLTELEFRQLDKILLNAAEFPGTIPEVVHARVEAEANYDAALDSAVYCLDAQRGQNCRKQATRAELESKLKSSLDLAERRKLWEASMQPGASLRDQLSRVRDLRNRVATELGYSSYFHLRVADYGMSVSEMMKLMEETVGDIGPIYQAVHRYAARRLAQRHRQPAPERIPAHWFGDPGIWRWTELADAVEPPPRFGNRSPQWVVEQAARFYTAMGWPALPRGFWERSDLYALPEGATRRKHGGAATWQIDRDQDVRCLMNVAADWDGFRTSHRQLGTAYYYLACANPQVPVVLREPASRAFLHAVAGLFERAASDRDYLRRIGAATPKEAPDTSSRLLLEALEGAVTGLPWYAGVLTQFEYELYEQRLPANRFNRRWWELVGRYQQIAPPGPRGDESCDACLVALFAEQPAQSYDYALGYLIQHQLQEAIARHVLKQDPRKADYFGNREVGRWLWDLLQLGATRDWRQVLREKTGEDISSRATVEYYRPLLAYLAEAKE